MRMILLLSLLLSAVVAQEVNSTDSNSTTTATDFNITLSTTTTTSNTSTTSTTSTTSDNNTTTLLLNSTTSPLLFNSTTTIDYGNNTTPDYGNYSTTTWFWGNYSSTTSPGNTSTTTWPWTWPSTTWSWWTPTTPQSSPTGCTTLESRQCKFPFNYEVMALAFKALYQTLFSRVKPMLAAPTLTGTQCGVPLRLTPLLTMLESGESVIWTPAMVDIFFWIMNNTCFV